VHFLSAWRYTKRGEEAAIQAARNKRKIRMINLAIKTFIFGLVFFGISIGIPFLIAIRNSDSMFYYLFRKNVPNYLGMVIWLSIVFGIYFLIEISIIKVVRPEFVKNKSKAIFVFGTIGLSFVFLISFYLNVFFWKCLLLTKNLAILNALSELLHNATRRSKIRHPGGRPRVSYNEATQVPHPHSGLRPPGGSSGSPERPKRGLSGIYRPLFGRSSEPNAPVNFPFLLMVGSRRCIS